MMNPLRGGNDMKRRDFLAVAASAGAAGAVPRLNLQHLPVRKAGKVEIVFESPARQPNGLQATAVGLWIIDQGEGSKAFLVSYEGGRVLRSFETETDRSSGVTFDGQSL